VSRRRRGDSTVDGVVVVDKPGGITSFDVVRQLKRSLGTSRVGHTGTLDPMATGGLVICAGWSTRLVPFLSDGWKRYTGTMLLGVATTTDDAEGEMIATSDTRPTTEELERGVSQLVGEISQVPPQFSAIKIDGKRAYKHARQGEHVDLAARTATVREFRIDRTTPDEVTFDVSVSKGTYIRSLARDLGEALGCYAHLTSLRRVENGGFHEPDFLQIADVGPDRLMTPWRALSGMPLLRVSDEIATRLEQGQRVPNVSEYVEGDRFRIARESLPDRLVAICDVRAGEDGTILRTIRVRPPRG
jgi:tRNA pseudouridine55 synthase